MDNDGGVSAQAELLEPRLPQELEQIIFEIAAHHDQGRMVPVLMQVARRVRNWVYSVLYDSIVLGDPSFYMESELPLHRPPRFPSGSQILHVRNLLIRDLGVNESEPNWTDFLKKCHNVQDLAIWAELPRHTLSLVTTAIRSPLRAVSPCGLLRLSVSLADLFPDGRVDFHHEIFQGLTHLEVIGFPRETGGQWVEGNNYGCLTSLRYLSIFSLHPDYAYPVELLKKCLEECKALEVLILPYNTEHIRELNKTQRVTNLGGRTCKVPEDRVIVHGGLLIPGDKWSKAWHRGATGGEDVWTQAEKMLRRRRWKRELEVILWDSVLDRNADVNLGEWLFAMEVLCMA